MALNSDDSTRQERSGIASAAALFASTSPANAGPGLSFSNSSDDLAQLIKNNPNSLHDPVAASGALIVNATPRKVAAPVNLTQTANSNNAPETESNLFNALAASSNAPEAPTTVPAAPLIFAPQPTAVATNINTTPDITSTPKAVNVPLSSLNAAASTTAPIAATAQIEPIAPILVNTPPALTVAATPVNDSLTPFSPDAFKAIENENTLAENNIEPEKPVVKVATTPVLRKVSITDIKPVAKPLVATHTNQTMGKIVKVNYTPPAAPKVINAPAKSMTKPMPATKEKAPIAKASPASKEKNNATVSKPPVKVTAKAPQTSAKETIKGNAPANTPPNKGKGKVTATVVANKPVEKPSKQANNTAQKTSVKNDKTPPAPKPQANNMKPAIAEKKVLDKSKTADKTIATATDKKAKPIKKN